jgi:hypothetical protein
VLDSHVISTALKNSEQIIALQADLNPNLETTGTVFRTKHPGNGAVAFHDDGRVCAIGGWDGRCVPHPTNVDLSADDRVSSVLKNNPVAVAVEKNRR